MLCRSAELQSAAVARSVATFASIESLRRSEKRAEDSRRGFQASLFGLLLYLQLALFYQLEQIGFEVGEAHRTAVAFESAAHRNFSLFGFLSSDD